MEKLKNHIGHDVTIVHQGIVERVGKTAYIKDNPDIIVLYCMDCLRDIIEEPQ